MPPKKSTPLKKSIMTIDSDYKKIYPNEVKKGKKYTIELKPHPDHGNKTSITGKLLGRTNTMTGNVQNFGIEEETPDVFDTNNNEASELTEESNSSEEDEFEIPAFLRRQKN